VNHPYAPAEDAARAGREFVVMARCLTGAVLKKPRGVSLDGHSRREWAVQASRHRFPSKSTCCTRRVHRALWSWGLPSRETMVVSSSLDAKFEP